MKGFWQKNIGINFLIFSINLCKWQYAFYKLFAKGMHSNNRSIIIYYSNFYYCGDFWHISPYNDITFFITDFIDCFIIICFIPDEKISNLSKNAFQLLLFFTPLLSLLLLFLFLILLHIISFVFYFTVIDGGPVGSSSTCESKSPLLLLQTVCSRARFVSPAITRFEWQREEARRGEGGRWGGEGGGAARRSETIRIPVGVDQLQRFAIYLRPQPTFRVKK